MDEIEKAIKSARAAQSGRIFGSFEDKEEVDEQSLSKGQEDELIKGGKPAVAGEVRTWNGKNYKKQPNGKWLEVSDRGYTKTEHEKRRDRFKNNAKGFREEGNLDEFDKNFEAYKRNEKVASSLSDKEHTDEEVGISTEKIGKTKSGKDIYNVRDEYNHPHPKHSSFTDEDYKDASELHNKLATQALKDNPNFIWNSKDEKNKKTEEKYWHHQNAGAIYFRLGNPKDNLYGGKVKKSKENNFEKSDIMDSLNYNSEIKISKTGKEIKEQIDNVIMPELTSNLAVAKNEADEKLKDCGLAPTRNVENYWTDNIKIDCGYKMYCWDETRISKNDGNIVNSLSAEDAASKKGNYPENEAQSLARERYNEAIRKICNILVDIKACEVLKTLKDETKFELSPRQVITFKF